MPRQRPMNIEAKTQKNYYMQMQGQITDQLKQFTYLKKEPVIVE